MAQINVTDLTSGTAGGTGIFDQLMASMKAHIQDEYANQRIKGSDYAQVYLGGLQSVMDRSLQFLLNQQKVDLEAQLTGEQITKIQAETALVNQQITNLVSEELRIDAETARINQATALLTEQTVSETRNHQLDGLIDKQICKLNAEYNLLVEQITKTTTETGLLSQKKVTEQAQTDGTNIDPTSVIGKQNALYQAQTDGFHRDAEQKAAKLLVDTWNVRQTTDGAVVDNVNKLEDAYIGDAVKRLLEGIGVTVV